MLVWQLTHRHTHTMSTRTSHCMDKVNEVPRPVITLSMQVWGSGTHYVSVYIQCVWTQPMRSFWKCLSRFLSICVLAEVKMECLKEFELLRETEIWLNSKIASFNMAKCKVSESLPGRTTCLTVVSPVPGKLISQDDSLSLTVIEVYLDKIIMTSMSWQIATYKPSTTEQVY